ncbi:MAG: peptidoglycan bridge formation glycyltransferase FemA/FemB family protein [Patescibacteria group bacterium]
MRKSFLQTDEWLEFQTAVGRKTFRFDNGKIGANIIRHDLPFGKNYLYIPHGPTIQFDGIEGGLKHEIGFFFKYLRELAREQKSIFVKIEPLSDTITELIFDFGLRKSKKHIQPHKTVALNLALQEDVLLSQMHHKTRYNIKLAQNHDIRVQLSDDIEIFWNLLKKTTTHDKFYAHEKKYYQKLLTLDGRLKTNLLIAYHGKTPVAGAIILMCDDISYYLHGASDHDFRNLMAPYALHWDIIKHLKALGFLFYDFWGIDAQRWPGVTRFKLGFGGQTIEYPGSFDLPISKFWYFIYNLARKIR